MEQTEYEKLEFPYSLEALTRYTIAETASDLKLSGETNADDFMKTSRIASVPEDALDLPSLINLLEEQGVACQWNQTDRSLKLSAKEKTRIDIPLEEPLNNKMLICMAAVTSPSGREVTIELNGIRNRLSGKSAPYPNRNDTFTWMISSNEEIPSLRLALSAGTYILSEIRLWTMDLSQWGNQNIREVAFSPDPGNAVFLGSSALKEDGWFVTSFPYREGYQVQIDGENVPVCRVNTGFAGFPLKAGNHEIVITYRPPGKQTALMISLLSLLVFLAAGFRDLFSAKDMIVRNRIFKNGSL